jgi:hypothetical protein
VRANRANRRSAPAVGRRLPTAHQHAGGVSYGNPEDDSIAFAAGTGQFDGISGAASFHRSGAGARFTGTLKSTLSG